MKKVSLLFLFALLLLSSCKGGSGGTATKQLMVEDESVLYAGGFDIKKYDDFTVVEISNPWDSTKLLHKYILIDRDKPVPANLPEGTIISIPIKKAIIYTAVHTAIIEQLGAVNCISGICESQYVTSPIAARRVKEGIIKDCGASTSPNIEKIIDIGGEIIIASPFEHSSYGQAEKIGIPIFEAADYMEDSPLGRAEWIKLYGLLTGRQKEADSIFTSTVKHYNELKQLVASARTRPTVLAERKYGSSWFIPGGKSYTATMYKDAGAEYVFNNNDESGSVPMSFETVFERGVHAEIWLLKYTLNRPMTYNDLVQEFPSYSGFDAYKNKRIFACNTTSSSYYENISTHPDYILEDLVAIFHPELIKDYKMRFFLPMAE